MTIWMQLAAIRGLGAIARKAAKDKTDAARAAYEGEGATPRFAQLASEARKARSLVSAYFN